MLEIRNLSVGYPERTVISDLQLSLPEGSLTVIAGPNGCGKTTLMKAITGLLPSSGFISFRNVPLSGADHRQRARLLAFLPQSRPVPQITVEKLVMHGRFPYLSYPRRYRAEDKAAAREALEQLKITHLADRYLPTLSGGERQKAYIAMLLAQGTPVILMDEPTAYLDICHKFEVLQISRQLANQGKTVILVLHDLDLAMNYADRIVLMDHGRISLCDSPDGVYESGIPERVFHIRMDRVETDRGPRYFFLPKM